MRLDTWQDELWCRSACQWGHVSKICLSDMCTDMCTDMRIGHMSRTYVQKCVVPLNEKGVPDMCHRYLYGHVYQACVLDIWIDMCVTHLYRHVP